MVVYSCNRCSSEEEIGEYEASLDKKLARPHLKI
jgi:hypothetical protein